MKIEKLIESAKEVTDPRRLWGNLRHKLESILIIGLISMLCGGKDFVDMEVLGKAKYEWLKGFLDLPNGTPDSDTFRRVFERIDGDELSKCLTAWANDRQIVKQVSIDGKTSRGSANNEYSAYHIVSAWAGEQGLTLGQVVVDEKSNEITAIPELLKLLDIKGAIVTIDAMGCQTDIAAAICDKKADYVLALKGNQKNTLKQVTELFSRLDNGESELCLDEYTVENIDHGRIEKRITTVISASSIQNKDKWANLQTIVRCRYINNVKGKEVVADRYFLSSVESNARRISSAIRGHWSIENQLHWVLDVVFDEDASQAKKGNSPINMNVLRKIALNLLINAKPNKRTSYQKMMFRAAMQNQYLETILFKK